MRALKAALRARVPRRELSPADAACVEKDDLVTLLVATSRRAHVGATALALAEAVAAALRGLPVALACGCPAPGLVVGGCLFVHTHQPAPDTPPPPRPGIDLWGDAHVFILDRPSSAQPLGQLSAAIYDWERRAIGFADADGAGAPSAGPEPAPAADGQSDVHIPADHAADSPAAALARACAVQLTHVSDPFARAVLPPNLARVWAADARAAAARLARMLHWPRVRLLFLGHREGADAAAAHAAAVDIADAAEPAAHAAPPPAAKEGADDGGGGCLFALLDRELLWLIAESLVAIEADATGGGEDA